jgi:hypothetical protein
MSPSLSNEQLTALHQAFKMACAELGLASNADDRPRRERLSELIVGVANEGKINPREVAQRACELMRADSSA